MSSVVVDSYGFRPPKSSEWNTDTKFLRSLLIEFNALMAWQIQKEVFEYLSACISLSFHHSQPGGGAYDHL